MKPLTWPTASSSWARTRAASSSSSRTPCRGRAVPAQFISAEFVALKKRLDDLIHPMAQDDEEEKLPMVKLTDAGDDVE